MEPTDVRVSLLASYQKLAHETAAYLEQNPDLKWRLAYIGLGLTGESGEVADNIKKLLRGDPGTTFSERVEMLEKELGDVLWYLSEGCTLLGLNLEDVASKNLQKLQSRKQRNQLKGEGDER
jgi:NTP pyrophosphatase (non-canonical NTP hydrolase)